MEELRGFERSTPSRGTASSAGSGQSSNSGCRSLDRAVRPSCSNESVQCGRKSWLLRSGRERGAREVGPRLRPRSGRPGAAQGEGGKDGKGRVGVLGVKVADEELRGRAGVLIDDVEKQRLSEASAPCPNRRRQT